MMRRLRVSVALFLGAVLLSGCGGLRLYNEARDRQGAKVEEAWGKVDLNEVIVRERANLTSLLDAELETQNQLAIGIRDNYLRFMVGAENLKTGLVDPVSTRLDEIAGSIDQLEASRKIEEKNRKVEVSLQPAEPDFTKRQLAVPTCASLANGATPKDIAEKLANDPELALLVERVRTQCRDVEDVYAGLGGKIQKAAQEYQTELSELQAAKAQSAPLQAAYKDALDAYKKTTTSTDPDATEKVKSATEKLQAATASLAAAQDAFSIKFLSEERLKSIASFTDAIVTTPPGGEPPKGANDATTALIVFPALLDDARKALDDAKQPLAMPLLVRKNHTQLNLEAANREIASRAAVVRLSGEIVESLYEEALALRIAYRLLDQDGKPLSAKYSQRVAEAFSKASVNDKEALYGAAARYLDALGRIEPKVYRLEYMRVAAYHERTLAYAEVNLKQWQSLIGVTVDQLAAFGAGGIKSEQIIALLNAAGVIWIGNGVNK